MSNVETNDDLVAILVPRHLVIAVYQLISEKSKNNKSNNLPTQHPAENSGIADRVSDNWPPPLLKRMYKESSKNMRAILDTLAAHAGEIVTARELVPFLSPSQGEKANSLTLAGTLGAFGRRWANRYEQEEWPFEAEWSEEDNQVHYRMSPEVARSMQSE